MLQPEPDASGQSRKTTVQETAKTACICDFFREGRTHPERFDLTRRKSLVQIQHHPLRFSCKLQYFMGVKRGSGGVSGPVCCNPSEIKETETA